MKENLVIAPYSKTIQILTLASDRWFKKYFPEFFNVKA